MKIMFVNLSLPLEIPLYSCLHFTVIPPSLSVIQLWQNFSVPWKLYIFSLFLHTVTSVWHMISLSPAQRLLWRYLTQVKCFIVSVTSSYQNPFSVSCSELLQNSTFHHPALLQQLLNISCAKVWISYPFSSQ